MSYGLCKLLIFYLLQIVYNYLITADNVFNSIPEWSLASYSP